MERKVANVQKQALKGIKQLVGTSRNIKRHLPILSSSRETVQLDSTLVPHAVVLVSELLPFGDWTKVRMQLIQAMKNEGMYVHLMDCQEFNRYLKASS